MSPHIVVLRELVSTSLYPLDEREVAQAMLARCHFYQGLVRLDISERPNGWPERPRG